MCKYCEGRALLITTAKVTGHNIDVRIWDDKLVAESSYEDAYGKETVNKGIKINYCPVCGRPLQSIKGGAI